MCLHFFSVFSSLLLCVFSCICVLFVCSPASLCVCVVVSFSVESVRGREERSYHLWVSRHPVHPNENLTAVHELGSTVEDTTKYKEETQSNSYLSFLVAVLPEGGLKPAPGDTVLCFFSMAILARTPEIILLTCFPRCGLAVSSWYRRI